MKLKPILPSLKEKKRYLSFEIVSGNSVSSEQAMHAINKQTLQLLGTLEAGKAGIMFLSDKYAHNTGVLKTGHKYVDKVRTALALITVIDDNKVMFRTRVVSGTLKRAMSKFQGMRRAEVY
jgi:ribonuclease P/MRP protein subunit POP5